MNKALKKIYDGWMRFVYVLGEINGRVIFTLLFIVIVGPYALVRKIIVLFSSKGKPYSTWQEKSYREPTQENLRRQF